MFMNEGKEAGLYTRMRGERERERETGLCLRMSGSRLVRVLEMGGERLVCSPEGREGSWSV